MKTFTIVAVFGRPSANVRDFFNSIKLWTYEVGALSREGALGNDNDPAAHDATKFAAFTSNNYELINWYAFEKKEK